MTLRALFLLMISVPLLGACAAPYEAMPTSVYQWERRQTEIEGREADRVRLCQTLDKESARYQRDCGAGVKP